MRIIFMGTPDFSVGTLEALVEAGHDVCLAVTQPDKPKGRGKEMQFTPVKAAAMKHGIPVYQPKKIRDPECVEELRKYNADVMVVVAFGQILPKEILEMTPYGCINVHASLLPKYRGAAPIQWAIIEGESVTGVTTMQMDEGLDTGDVILQSEFALDDEITAGELHDKMTVEGAKVLCETLDLIKEGKAPRTPQNHDEFTYAPIMDKNLGHVDFSKTAREVHNLVRGVNPWPSAYTMYMDKKMKVWKTKVLNEKSSKEPGTILKVDQEGIKVATKDNVILISEIQMPNKKRMEVKEFIKGNTLEVGNVLQ